MAKQVRLPKTTRQQYEMLLEFLENHPIAIRGKNKPSEVKIINNLWDKFANEVNIKKTGPFKTSLQWKRIFSEWKMNTKRKSRLLRVAEMGTGGGPHSGKRLSDLEERLLSLLSNIHLGDDSLPESLGGAESKVISQKPSEVVEMVEIDCDEDYNMSYEQEHDQPDLMLESRKDVNLNEMNDITFTFLENQVEPCSSAPNCKPTETPKSKFTKDYRKKTNSRYSSNLVSEAVQEFKKVQEALVDSTKENQESQAKIAEALINIGSALSTHNTIYERMVQCQEKIAEAKIISSRAMEKIAEAKLISAKAKEKLAQAEISKKSC